MTVLTQSQAAISVGQKVVTVMELIPEMLTHPTLDDTARHFFSSESAGIPARHMKLIPEIRHRQRFIYKTKRRKGSRTVIIGGKRH
ncbi:hypothetical protein SRHO_G00345400 [Serrasalmus rhombeus]